MNKKEEIILATLELAAERGLRSLSMAQIAEKVGIRKPSLYNHFESKEYLMKEMYVYLRAKSKTNNSIDKESLLKFIQTKSAKEVLNITIMNYMKMVNDEKMYAFYKVIYSERAISPEAANILVEETNTMIEATKGIFQLLNKFNKLKIDNIEMAATSFSMTIHSLIDYEQDCKSANIKVEEDKINKYIDWFCSQYGKES